MQLLCGQCGRTTSVSDDHSAASVPCPNCGHEIPIPRFDGPANEHATETTATGQDEGFAAAAREMMARKLVIVCGSCGRNLKTSRKLVGRKVRCPACRARIRVPSPDESPQAVPTVRARGAARAIDLPEEDLAGLPEAKLVRPPLSAWLYFVLAMLAGAAGGAILLSILR